jgi:hypothetical protein
VENVSKYETVRSLWMSSCNVTEKGCQVLATNYMFTAQLLGQGMMHQILLKSYRCKLRIALVDMVIWSSSVLMIWSPFDHNPYSRLLLQMASSVRKGSSLTNQLMAATTWVPGQGSLRVCSVYQISWQQQHQTRNLDNISISEGNTIRDNSY